MDFYNFLTVKKKGEILARILAFAVCPNSICKNFKNWSVDNVFMTKMNFEYEVCIINGDNPKFCPRLSHLRHFLIMF